MRMFRRLLPVIGIVAILLAACGQGTSEPPTPTATMTAVATAVPTPTEEGEQATTDPSAPVEITTPEAPGVCRAAPLPILPVPPVTDSDWIKGASPDAATITIVEYSDFQCPGCAGMYPVLQEFLDENPDVRLVYRHFPLDFHQHALITAQAAEAAGAQGKFWEMHNIIFDHYSEWVSLSEEEIRPVLSSYAEQIGLDVAKFDAALDEGTYLEKVQAQYNESVELGLPGTPSFLFNDVLFPSDIGLSKRGLEAFKNIIENQDEFFFEEPPEMTISEDGSYEAVLETSKGEIQVELFPASAPTHVNNFVFLAQQKWYDGSDFFFVRDNFVAVTGDPTNSTVGYPGYYCKGEEQGVFDRPGLVGMLSNGQFFITLGSDAEQLNGKFALIGQVREGLDVLDALNRLTVGDPSAPPADVLQTVEIVTD